MEYNINNHIKSGYLPTTSFKKSKVHKCRRDACVKVWNFRTAKLSGYDRVRGYGGIPGFPALFLECSDKPDLSGATGNGEKELGK
jgi:hypothetical protein